MDPLADIVLPNDAQQQQQQRQQQQPPPQEEEEEEEGPMSNFDKELAWLKDQDYDSFQFLDAVPIIHNGEPPNNIRWSMEQARDIFDALMASSVIQTLFAELELCQPQAIGLFVEYIRTSESLKDLSVAYDRTFLLEDGDPLELQNSYQSQFDVIFRAVLTNPSIASFATKWLGASPNSIHELLSQTTSLESFELAIGESNQGHDPNYETAFGVAAGLSQNSSLKRVKLYVSNEGGNLGVMISGLDRHPILNELIIWYECPDVDLFVAISKVLHFAPLLTKLEVREDDSEERLGQYNVDKNFDKVLLSLSQPICARLKELCLTDVRLGMGWRELQGDATSVTSLLPTDGQPTNNVLEKLTLTRCIFFGRDAVSILWRLVGIRVLTINGVFYDQSPDDDPGHDERNSSVWQALIERNKMMESVSLDDVNLACFNGILQGAMNHEKLESLHYLAGPEIQEPTGKLLRRVLQSSKTSLKDLSLTQCTIRRSGVDQIVQGICDNKTLVSLDLDDARLIQISYTTIIGSLLVNKTIKYLRVGNLGTEIPYNGAFGSALLSVARVNEALIHLHLPRVDFRGSMSQFLRGFGEKSRVRTLNLSKCRMDADGLVALGRVLERKDIALDYIELPRIMGDSDPAYESFIGSLHKVPRRFKVGFLDIMDKEPVELLLQAAKENKNLFEVNLRSHRLGDDDRDILTNLSFYLKLNQRGLGLFGCPSSVPDSLWPTILANMAASPDHTDALFYIMREFMVSSKPSSAQQQQEAGQARPNKRARLDA